MNNKKQPAKVGIAEILPARIVGPMFFRVALIVVFLTGGLVYLGMFLDASFNTRPVFTVLLAVTSSLLLVFIVYRVGLEADEKSQEVYREWKLKNVNEAQSSELQTDKSAK